MSKKKLATVTRLPTSVATGVARQSLFVTDEQKPKVAFIPGLRVDEAGQCHGSVDAVEAAAIATGQNFASVAPVTFDWRMAQEERKALAPNLYPFQLEGVARLVSLLRAHGGALLCDDMGLGKTRQCLGVLRVIKPSRTLLVVPASVRQQWVDEAKVMGLEAVAITKGKDAEKLAAAPLIVTSYALVEKVLDALPDFPTFIGFDEGHRLMGRKSKAALALVEACDTATNRLTLTGTPIWSETRNFYMQLRLVLGRRFGKAFDFDVRYCNGHFGEHGFINKGASHTEELKQRLSHYTVRRTKAEVAQQLPALARSVRWVDGEPDAKRKLSLMMASPQKTRIIDALMATLDAKVEMAVEACIEARQFLCFSYTRKHVAMIADGVRKAGLDVVVLTGADTAEQRRAKVKDALTRRCGVVATFGAASTGVDGLQFVASTGIMHSLLWVPTEMMQAEARLHRFGASMETPVHWVYLCMRDSADEFVQTTLVRRLDTWGRVMHANGDGTKELRDSLDDSFGVLPEEDARVLRSLVTLHEGDEVYDLELGGDE